MKKNPTADVDNSYNLIINMLHEESNDRTIEKCMKLLNYVNEYYKNGHKLYDGDIYALEDYIKNDLYSYYSRKYFDKEQKIKDLMYEIVKSGLRFSSAGVMDYGSRDTNFVKQYIKIADIAIDYSFVKDIAFNNTSLNTILSDDKFKLNVTQNDADEYFYFDEKKAEEEDEKIKEVDEDEDDDYDDPPRARMAGVPKHISVRENKELHELIGLKILDCADLEIKQKYVYAIIKNGSLELLKRVILRGTNLDNKCLEYACAICPEVSYYSSTNSPIKTIQAITEKIKFILENKIQPTKKSFMNIIKAGINGSGRYIRNGRKTVDKDDRLELLLSYGYNLTYDDVKHALKNYIMIMNIEKYNIKFDATILHICSNIGAYPYTIKDINPDIECLVNECKKSGNLATIKKLVTTYKLSPNNMCLKEACKIRSNYQTIKYLLSKNVKVDIDCIGNLIQAHCNRALVGVFDEYKKSLDPNAKMTIGGEAHEEKYEEGQEDELEEEEIEEEDEEEDEDEDDDNPKPKTKAKKIPKKKIIKEKKEVVKETIKETNKEIIKEEIKEAPKKSSIPEAFDYASDIISNVPEKIKALIGQQKTTSLKFVDLRKLLLEYLNKNKQITKDGLVLKEPYLYNKVAKVSMTELNEWIYSLLIFADTANKEEDKEDVKDSDEETIKSKSKVKTTKPKVIKIAKEKDSDDEASIDSRRNKRITERQNAAKVDNEKKEEPEIVKPKKVTKTTTTKIVKEKVTKKVVQSDSDDDGDDVVDVVEPIKKTTKKSMVKSK